MASYKIALKGSAEHDLRKIDQKFIKKIIDAIETLTESPFLNQSRKLTNTEASFRLRIGEYRIIYQVDMVDRIITVSHIRHRKDAYRK
jgi:mRNA interferase RelE/StbE